MKVQGKAQPVMLSDPEQGNRVHSEKVTHVLLTSGWVEIVPKSFKLLASKANNGTQIPWVVFKQKIENPSGNVKVVQVELTSPSSLHAVAYDVPGGDDE